MVDTELVSTSADRFGQLFLGSITVRAALVVGLARSESQSFSDSQYGTPSSKSIRDNLRMASRHGTAAREIVIRTRDHEYTGFCYFDTEEMRQRLERESFLAVTCLPILLHFLSFNKTGNDAEVSIRLQGILVEMVEEGRISGRGYNRVGYFSATSKLESIRTGWRLCQS